MHAEIKILNGPSAGQSVLIDSPKFLIGRERDCQFRPDSDLVSRYHCVLKMDGYTLRVRDMGSRNGTFVNGRKVAGETVLQHGDTLLVGTMSLRVVLMTPSRGPGSDAGRSQEATKVEDGATLMAESGNSYPPPPTREFFLPPSQTNPVPLPIVPPLGFPPSGIQQHPTMPRK